MKWHYLKNEGYPTWYAQIIVKCAEGDVLKTGCSIFDESEDYCQSFAVSYYDDEGFDANIGSLKWINVVAWCYIEEVYEELQKQGCCTIFDDKYGEDDIKVIDYERAFTISKILKAKQMKLLFRRIIDIADELYRFSDELDMSDKEECKCKLSIIEALKELDHVAEYLSKHTPNILCK